MILRLLFIVLFLSQFTTKAQDNLKLALLKYNGGGDWYANPTALPNLATFCNMELSTKLNVEYATVEVGSPDLFNYPFVHMTGHGNVVFSSREALNLREYLLAGGFLHVDDNYGLDKFFRREIKKVFPDKELVELPKNHPIFSQHFAFTEGLPKIHEHDKKPPQAFAIFDNGRMVMLYTYECDLGDGWESKEVHNDSDAIHLKALRMGANIVEFVFNGQD